MAGPSPSASVARSGKGRKGKRGRRDGYAYKPYEFALVKKKDARKKPQKSKRCRGGGQSDAETLLPADSQET